MLRRDCARTRAEIRSKVHSSGSSGFLSFFVHLSDDFPSHSNTASRLWQAGVRCRAPNKAASIYDKETVKQSPTTSWFELEQKPPPASVDSVDFEFGSLDRELSSGVRLQRAGSVRSNASFPPSIWRTAFSERRRGQPEKLRRESCPVQRSIETTSSAGFQGRGNIAFGSIVHWFPDRAREKAVKGFYGSVEQPRD